MKNLIYVIAVLLVGMLTCNVNNVIYAGDDAEAKKKETVAQEAQEVSLTGVIVKQEVTRKKGDEEQKYNLFFLQTDDGNKIALSDKVAKEANLDLTQAEGKKYTLQAQAVVKKTKEGKNHITIVKINQATCADAPATTPAPAQ